MSALTVRGDAARLPLADETVDLIVTSPPYFALRSYTDGGEHYAGQIGSEASPAEFLEALWQVTAECVRVLKPSGSLWVNLGDKFSQRVAIRPSSHQDGLFPDRSDLPKDWKRDKALGLTRMPYQNVVSDDGRYVPEKSLMGLPWRYAIGCVDRLGLILRAEVIWAKPNGLPESVTDRVRRSHETWFHLTRQPRYYSAVDTIREAYTAAPFRGQKRHDAGDSGATRNPVLASLTSWDASGYQGNPLGKLPGSVWEVATEPLTVPVEVGVDHFAAFPSEWPRRLILGWSPSGICTGCGGGRRPVVEHAEWWAEHKRLAGLGDYMANRRDVQALGARRAQTAVRIPPGGKHVITGETCGCPEPSAPTRPAIVLDPFSGTGTTVAVAQALGRIGVGVDLSADYCRLARWRANDPNLRAKVLGYDRPPAIPAGQADLFTEVTA